MCIYRRVIIIIREAIDLRKRGMGGGKGKERSSIFQVLYFKCYISSINALNILKRHPEYLENSKTG